MAGVVVLDFPQKNVPTRTGKNWIKMDHAHKIHKLPLDFQIFRFPYFFQDTMRMIHGSTYPSHVVATVVDANVTPAAAGVVLLVLSLGTQSSQVERQPTMT